MKTETQIKDYFIVKAELVTTREYLSLKLDDAIKRNTENPSKKLSVVIAELNQMVKMLDRSILYIIRTDEVERSLLHELSKKQSIINTLTIEIEELKTKNENLIEGL